LSQFQVCAIIFLLIVGHEKVMLGLIPTARMIMSLVKIGSMIQKLECKTHRLHGKHIKPI